MNKGDLTGAEPYAREAVARSPRLADARLTLGDVLLRMGKTEAGMRELSAAAALDAGSPDSIYKMAIFFEHRRLVPQAGAIWKRSLHERSDPQPASVARSRFEALGCGVQ